MRKEKILITNVRNALDKALEAMDDSGWYPYPNTAPEEPETSPDNMPSRDEYDNFEEFAGDRSFWIDRKLTQFLVFLQGASVPMILYWGGNDYGFIDINAQPHPVIAWQELPEPPLFANVEKEGD